MMPTRAATCRICQHAERPFIDALLKQGFAPRSLIKRIGGTTRKSLARHRDRCLPPSDEEEAGE